ncbi:MAG: CpsD/CapB family tyrosine-protein kinase [Lachnospiraceae bacterium]|nr:CpsD/CapB family tyrosine-protein kinase [Lachnospiraceae bacterium]
MSTDKNKLASGRTEQRELLCENLSFAASEAYKLLRANLKFALNTDKRCPVVGITSSTRGEGKTTTSINLAYTIAQTGKKVLLVDGDMRLPNVARSLMINRRPGLSDFIVGAAQKAECIRRSQLLANWEVIPAGNIPPNPSELLSSESMARFIERSREEYEYIILDLPPVGIVSDALVAANILDGLIMVVREDYSSRKFLNQCIAQFNPLREKLLGFVLTDVTKNNKGYYYRSHHRAKTYGKQYGYGSKGFDRSYSYGYGYGYEDAARQAGKAAKTAAEPKSRKKL